jgi:YHS domain-containing protein
MNYKSLMVSFLFWMMIPFTAIAGDTTHSLVGIQGYDPVSYFQKDGPKHGNGDHVAYFDGVTYIFATDANKKTFQSDPAKYLPAYGGYCAFGVAVGKKIVSDPTVWKIVDGKLYLNLNARVGAIWSKDIAGYIKKANEQWPKIKNSDPES